MFWTFKSKHLRPQRESKNPMIYTARNKNSSLLILHGILSSTHFCKSASKKCLSATRRRKQLQKPQHSPQLQLLSTMETEKNSVQLSLLQSSSAEMLAWRLPEITSLITLWKTTKTRTTYIVKVTWQKTSYAITSSRLFHLFILHNGEKILYNGIRSNN